MNFANKVVLVTGASSGIGAAIALKFAEEGAKVAIVGRNEKKLKEVCKKLEKTGSKPLLIIADVTKDSDAKNIINETLKKFGKLDVLINNAGMGGKKCIVDDDAMQQFDLIMNTNVRGLVQVTHLASKHIIKSKGNIINISSVAAKTVTFRENFCYCTSKAAVDHFTRAIAAELAPMGVRVNTVNPGPVKTDFLENMGITSDQEKEMWEHVKNATALKRVSEPEEIAELTLFLASDKAAAITGASFLTDNGLLVNTLL